MMNTITRPSLRFSIGDTIQLWWCRTDDMTDETAVELSYCWLNERERQEARRFVFDHDRRQYMVSHALVRRVLNLHTGVAESEQRFWRGSRGRPFLTRPADGWPHGHEHLDFNLSHTRGMNVVGVAAGRRIGVDVERFDHRDRRALDRVAEAFSPQERHWLSSLPEAVRMRFTLRLWTLKEAYAKARGLGLSLPFDSFSFSFDSNYLLREFRPPQEDVVGRWQFLELEPASSVFLAVAVEVVGTPVSHAHLHKGFPWSPGCPSVVNIPAPALEMQQ